MCTCWLEMVQEQFFVSLLQNLTLFLCQPTFRHAVAAVRDSDASFSTCRRRGMIFTIASLTGDS